MGETRVIDEDEEDAVLEESLVSGVLTDLGISFGTGNPYPLRCLMRASKMYVNISRAWLGGFQ